MNQSCNILGDSCNAVIRHETVKCAIKNAMWELRLNYVTLTLSKIANIYNNKAMQGLQSEAVLNCS